MRIRDIDISWIDKELDEVKHKPLCYETVEWFSALLSLRHRLEKEEYQIEKAVEHVEDAPKKEYRALTRYEAREWTAKLRNADGTQGEHWTMDQTKAVQKSNDIRCDEAEFYAVINALYSDFSKVMSSIGITDKDVDFWCRFAQGWLRDEDAMPHKAMRYLKCIVQK